jgi:hypothetical protein
MRTERITNGATHLVAGGAAVQAGNRPGVPAAVLPIPDSLAEINQIVAVSLSRVESTIVEELERVPGVMAVFCDDFHPELITVYTVVEEHDPRVYAAVVEAEDRIQGSLPGFEFSFRIRASQGREVRSPVPTGAEPLFVR